ncbi:hypothetical protein EST38_g1478 [Candolleomyces aberdarensis]|uniref:DUF6534 domain-containing protein n=1 Tax=Candolleomyces aberdarensis TaxID=2316362 RepID=A0A4Q2DVW0_9AGAR|nr:hypothetical protein EST38_g1478 [Candolleomyces aberdarensis]
MDATLRTYLGQDQRVDTYWNAKVLFLFVAETANTILNIHMIYEPLILNYGSQAAVTFFPIMLAADPILTVIISTPVQIFIAWRIRIVSKATWISIIIFLLALTAFSGGIWLSVTVVHIRRFSRKPELHWPALVWLLSSAIADILITVSLVYHLSRRKTGFSGTDTAINKIIRLTIQTGMVTAIFVTLDVICFLVLPHTTINFVWDFALCKLYTNALMSTLNARAGWNKLTTGQAENNLLFGTEYSSRSVASRHAEANTFSSLNFRLQHRASMGAEGVDHLAYAYEMQSPTTIKVSPSDLEYGVSVTKEVSTKADPLSLEPRTGFYGDTKPS